MRAAVLTSILLASATAAAQPGTYGPREVPVETETRSYARQTLVVDGLAFSLLIAGAAAEGPNGEDTTATGVLWAIGGPTALLGSPIVHLIHGRGLAAAGSLGLRYGLAMVGSFAGVAVADQMCGSGEAFCSLGGLGPGLLVGLVAASAIDAALIARETVEVHRPAPSIAPSIGVTRGGATLSLGGAF